MRRLPGSWRSNILYDRAPNRSSPTSSPGSSPGSSYCTPRGSHASSSRRSHAMLSENPPTRLQGPPPDRRSSVPFRHHVTFRRTPPPFHVISPVPISGSSSPGTPRNFSTNRPLKFHLPPRSRNRVMPSSGQAPKTLASGGVIALEEDTSRTVSSPGGAAKPRSRPITASMTSMLARRDYFGPDILIILGVSLTLIGVAVTLVGTYVQISNAEIKMLVMGIGPSLVAMGLLFSMLRLYFWRPKFCNCCPGWDRAVANDSGQSKNAVHPEDISLKKEEVGSGAPLTLGGVYSSRSTLSLDASVLMAACNTVSTNVMSPASLTTPSNDLSSRGTSNVNTPDDPHQREASENEDNEMTESLIQSVLARRDHLPVHLWNIPVTMAATSRRPRSAPVSQAASYPATPVEAPGPLFERPDKSIYYHPHYVQQQQHYHHYDRRRRSSLLSVLPSYDACANRVSLFNELQHNQNG